MSISIRIFSIIACLLPLCIFASSEARTLAAGEKWVQVASGPDREAAVARARAFLGLKNLHVFSTTTGWYAVALGPLPESSARPWMDSAKRRAAIPSDSFVTDGRTYRLDVWSADSSAVADLETLDAIKEEATWSHAQRVDLQDALVWSGDYLGRLDGAFGADTREAITAFQRRLGVAPTGYLPPEQRWRLLAIRDEATAATGFARFREPATGMIVGMAQRIFERDKTNEPTSGFVPYISRSGAARIVFFSLRDSEYPLDHLHRALVEFGEQDSPGDVYERLKEDWLVVSGEGATRSHYAFARRKGRLVQGFMIRWSTEATDLYRPIAIAMFNSFGTGPTPEATWFDRPPAVSASAPSAAPSAPPADSRAAPAEESFTGTGFYVSAQGDLLTNAHVAGDCRRILIEDHPAVLIAKDDDLDLAILRAKDPQRPDAMARFAARPARLNADVTVVGFPLHGLLGGLNVTRGVVSGQTGLHGDPSHLQITAQVQPGNSGGPMLDASGAVAGVVVAKLDAIEVASVVDDIPQNINFAIRGEAAKAFLARSLVNFDVDLSPSTKSPSDIAEDASRYTVLIRCQN